MNNSLKAHILRFLEKETRFDGRKLLDLRNITVETGVSKNAEGSARVAIGETEVLAGIKMAVETPYPDTPNSGNLMVNAELLPLSSPDFEAGPPNATAIEVARIVDRAIREAQAIDLKKLCITPGEKVWSVSIDVCSINSAGNLIDASALAAVAALRTAVFPSYKGGVIDYKSLTKDKVPMRKTPITVTVIKIGDKLLVDPLLEEEETTDARLTICIQDDDKVCALQKGGNEVLTIDEIDHMVGIAKQKAKEIRKVLGK